MSLPGINTSPLIVTDVTTNETNVFRREKNYILSKADLYVLKEKDSKLTVTTIFELLLGAVIGFSIQNLGKISMFMIDFSTKSDEEKSKINPNFTDTDLIIWGLSAILALIFYFASRYYQESTYLKSTKYQLIKKIEETF